MKRTQGGMTLIGFVLVLGLVGMFLYIGMKVIPMYTEYYAVKKSLDGLSMEPGQPSCRQRTFRLKQLGASGVRHEQPAEIAVRVFGASVVLQL